MAWQFDPAHSEVSFSVRHMMVSTVRGRFRDTEVTLDIDREHPERSRVEAVVRTESVDTGAADRDAHLRSPDFFDVERYPTLTFRSTQVELREGNHLRVTGDLTIRDVTRPVTLEGEYEGPQVDPWGNQRVGFSLSGEIDREEFGLTWNQGLETGGVLVGKKVKITIEAQVFEAAEVPAQA